MKLFSLCVLLFSLFTSNSYKEANYRANSYIVIEQTTNTVIDGVNYYKTQSVASISKIMTGILAIEYLDLDKKVYIDDCIDKAYGSAVYLKKGTWISNKDLIYGLLLRSGNDCALLLAKSVSNSFDNFINLMNKKAKLIGMNNTTFVNPHGLDETDGGNISCCYDMGLLQNYAMNNTIYKEVTSTKSYKSENYGIWINKNKLLAQYNNCISGKTGYTKLAKRTLVTSAKKDNLILTIVTLNCGGDFYYHKELYGNSFEKYGMKKVAEKGEIRFLNYKAYIEKDLFYFGFLEELEESLVFIKINEVTKEGSIYILINEQEEKIYTFKCEKVEMKESFWWRVKKIIKDLLL